MKCVIIIDENLPLGLIANTSAVLAVSIGEKMKNIVGDDVIDRDGQLHRGITQIPIPILKGTGESIRLLRATMCEKGTEDIFWVDFCDVAQTCKTYDEYKTKLQQHSADQLNYLGIALCGATKKIQKLTGSMGLLR